MENERGKKEIGDRKREKGKGRNNKGKNEIKTIAERLNVCNKE